VVHCFVGLGRRRAIHSQNSTGKAKSKRGKIEHYPTDTLTYSKILEVKNKRVLKATILRTQYPDTSLVCGYCVTHVSDVLFECYVRNIVVDLKKGVKVGGIYERDTISSL